MTHFFLIVKLFLKIIIFYLKKPVVLLNFMPGYFYFASRYIFDTLFLLYGST